MPSKAREVYLPSTSDWVELTDDRWAFDGADGGVDRPPRPRFASTVRC